MIVIPRCLRQCGGGLFLYQVYGNLYAMTALGWHLEEIHFVKTASQLLVRASQLLVTASKGPRDGVRTFGDGVRILKALYEGYSSKNYARKFLRAPHLKRRAKVTAIEESKYLTSLSLNELIRNLNVHELVIKKDYEIVKSKGKRKFLALRLKRNLVMEKVRLLEVKTNNTPWRLETSRILQEKSDSDEEDDEKAKDETCLMAQASSEGAYGCILGTLFRSVQMVGTRGSTPSHKRSDDHHDVFLEGEKCAKRLKSSKYERLYLERSSSGNVIVVEPGPSLQKAEGNSCHLRITNDHTIYSTAVKRDPKAQHISDQIKTFVT
ncbi:hypothetical protein Tco_0382677 [Tanacetum coccineum]